MLQVEAVASRKVGHPQSTPASVSYACHIVSTRGLDAYAFCLLVGLGIRPVSTAAAVAAVTAVLVRTGSTYLVLQ